MTASPTIAEQSAALIAGMATQAPPQIVEAFGTERSSLEAGGVPAGVARPGTRLPNAELLDVNGKPTTLDVARGGKPGVIVFYRGAWCPFCNIAFKAYQEELVPALAELGLELIAISPQKPNGSLTMQQKHALTFTLLSDPANVLAGQLGIVSPERAQAARDGSLQLGIDVPAANADDTDTLPMPTAIVANADGTIAWIDVRPNYAKRTEVAEIVAAARARP